MGATGHETDTNEQSAREAGDDVDFELQAELKKLRADIFNDPDLPDEEKQAQWDRASFAIRFRHRWSSERNTGANRSNGETVRPIY